MGFDPHLFWPARLAAYGETYPAQGGRAKSWQAQKRDIGELIRTHVPAADSGQRVLDFGCGPGRFRRDLEALGYSWDGYDFLPEMRTVESWPDDEYDAVVAILVLQHIVASEQYAEALSSIVAGLKPGGLLFAIDAKPAPRDWAEHMKPRGPEAIEAAARWKTVTTHEAMPGHWAGVFTS